MFISPSAPEYPSSSLFPEPSITPSPHLEGDVRMTLAEFLDAMQSEIDEFLKLQGQNIVAETRVRLQYLKLRMETERQWGRTIEWTRAERDRFRSTLESVLGVDMHSAGVFASTHIVPRIAREAHIELWRETHEAIQRGENSQSLTGDIPSVFRTFESLAVTPEASTVSVFDMELHLSMSAHDSVSDAVDRLIAYSNRYNALIVTDESHRPIGLLRERDCV